MGIPATPIARSWDIKFLLSARFELEKPFWGGLFVPKAHHSLR